MTYIIVKDGDFLASSQFGCWVRKFEDAEQFSKITAAKGFATAYRANVYKWDEYGAKSCKPVFSYKE
jgi:hypothetical protein